MRRTLPALLLLLAAACSSGSPGEAPPESVLGDASWPHTLGAGLATGGQVGAAFGKSRLFVVHAPPAPKNVPGVPLQVWSVAPDGVATALPSPGERRLPFKVWPLREVEGVVVVTRGVDQLPTLDLWDGERWRSLRGPRGHAFDEQYELLGRDPSLLLWRTQQVLLQSTGAGWYRVSGLGLAEQTAPGPWSGNRLSVVLGAQGRTTVGDYDPTSRLELRPRPVDPFRLLEGLPVGLATNGTPERFVAALRPTGLVGPQRLTLVRFAGDGSHEIGQQLEGDALIGAPGSDLVWLERRPTEGGALRASTFQPTRDAASLGAPSPAFTLRSSAADIADGAIALEPVSGRLGLVAQLSRDGRSRLAVRFVPLPFAGDPFDPATFQPQPGFAADAGSGEVDAGPIENPAFVTLTATRFDGAAPERLEVLGEGGGRSRVVTLQPPQRIELEPLRRYSIRLITPGWNTVVVGPFDAPAAGVTRDLGAFIQAGGTLLGNASIPLASAVDVAIGAPRLLIALEGSTALVEGFPDGGITTQPVGDGGAAQFLPGGQLAVIARGGGQELIALPSGRTLGPVPTFSPFRSRARAADVALQRTGELVRWSSTGWEELTRVGNAGCVAPDGSAAVAPDFAGSLQRVALDGSRTDLGSAAWPTGSSCVAGADGRWALALTPQGGGPDEAHPCAAGCTARLLGPAGATDLTPAIHEAVSDLAGAHLLTLEAEPGGTRAAVWRTPATGSQQTITSGLTPTGAPALSGDVLLLPTASGVARFDLAQGTALGLVAGSWSRIDGRDGRGRALLQTECELGMRCDGAWLDPVSGTLTPLPGGSSKASLFAGGSRSALDQGSLSIGPPEAEPLGRRDVGSAIEVRPLLTRDLLDAPCIPFLSTPGPSFRSGAVFCAR